jgi:hypothetical protein
MVPTLGRTLPLAILIACAAAACSGGGSGANPAVIGGGGAATPSPTPAVTATPSPTPQPGVPTASKSVSPSAATTVTLTTSSSATFNLNVPAGGVSVAGTLTVSEIGSGALPAPLSHVRRPQFTGGAGNTYVYAFTIALSSGVSLTHAVQLSASAFGNVAAGTVLNVAKLSGTTWSDVGTVTATASGTFTSNVPSTALPGVNSSGSYLIYNPAAGTNTAVANLGIALIADDGTLSPNGVQVVHLYDTNGNLLTTPTQSVVQFANNSDLDGAALTPDGSHGIVVDGSNKLGFFSGTQTGNPQPDANPLLDVSAYGSDGDSVAISPNGDEAVTALDTDKTLLVVSGILSGNPKPAAQITGSIDATSVVESADGKVLLARQSAGTAIDVWNVAPLAAPTAAPIAGATLSHSYTLASTLTGPHITTEDGRGGLAISPTDSTRALVIGVDGSANPVVNLLTGLPSSAAVSSAAALRVPAARIVAPSAERGRKPTYTLPGGLGVIPNCVAISPDGTYAVVGTNNGLVLVNGVNTGTLAQVGSALQPSGGSGSAMHTVAFTLDGKYVVTIVPSATQTGKGLLLVIPVTGSGSTLAFGAVAAQLDGVANPFNDQLLMH